MLAVDMMSMGSCMCLELLYGVCSPCANLACVRVIASQDVVICMMVPIIVKAVFSSDLPDRITSWFKVSANRNFFVAFLFYCFVCVCCQACSRGCIGARYGIQLNPTRFVADRFVDLHSCIPIGLAFWKERLLYVGTCDNLRCQLRAIHVVLLLLSSCTGQNIFHFVYEFASNVLYV